MSEHGISPIVLPFHYLDLFPVYMFTKLILLWHPSLAHYPVNSICSSYEPQGHIGFRQESVNKIQYEGGKTAGV